MRRPIAVFLIAWILSPHPPTAKECCRREKNAKAKVGVFGSGAFTAHSGSPSRPTAGERAQPEPRCAPQTALVEWGGDGTRASELGGSSYANSNARKRPPYARPLKVRRCDLDKQEAALRALNLDPAAENAALTALERTREQLGALASGSIAQRMSRAQRLLARMPAIVNTNRELIEGAIKALTDPRAVFAALEAIRRLLVENKILLAAVGNESSDHSSWGQML
jgi:hypothetical protein